jgi:hypothetical protein
MVKVHFLPELLADGRSSWPGKEGIRGQDGTWSICVVLSIWPLWMPWTTQKQFTNCSRSSRRKGQLSSHRGLTFPNLGLDRAHQDDHRMLFTRTGILYLFVSMASAFVNSNESGLVLVSIQFTLLSETNRLARFFDPPDCNGMHQDQRGWYNEAWVWKISLIGSEIKHGCAGMFPKYYLTTLQASGWVDWTDAGVSTG